PTFNHNNSHPMKKLFIIFLSEALLSASGIAQSKFYYTCIDRGDSLYKAGLFMESALLYHKAFQSYQGRVHTPHFYDAARSWAMAGEPDSAIAKLETLVYKERYSAYF